jgi:hypothetical protein
MWLLCVPAVGTFNSSTFYTLSVFVFLSKQITIISTKGIHRLVFVLGIKVKVKVKVKFTLEQATKAQRGSRGIALFFLESRR